jgi:gamma-glutamyltranspeptidase/glutathione hydrolase
MKQQAAVTSPCALATAAGVDVLNDGGNALEAAVAVSAVLAVTVPHFCGLGGDAVWLVADETGKVSTLMGIGQAAALARATGPIPTRGSGSTLTTAALVATWEKALRLAADWNGGIGLDHLLTSAIGHADAGVPVTASQSFWLDFRKEEAKAWPGFSALFDVGGDRLIQQQLARTLEKIARRGPREFYEGDLARRIAGTLEELGSPIRFDDLARTECGLEEPVETAYRDCTLFAPPQPTQGVTTLQAMGILNCFDLSSVEAGSVEHYHLAVESIKQAFLDRSKICDPDFPGSTSSDAMLVQEVLRQRSLGIDPQRAMPWGDTYRSADTVFFAVNDRAGRCVSALQSTYFDWGSGVVVGDTGILWQNRGAAFHHDQSHPNGLFPSKRPFYTLNPGIAFRDDRPHLLYGTQGADGQPQTLSLLLTGLLDYGMTPEAALRQPRFLLGKTFSNSEDSLKLEADAGDAAFTGLRKLGHELVAIDPLSPLGGQAGVIRLNATGRTQAAHDPRGDGVAVVIE